jgi:hypothetical protein
VIAYNSVFGTPLDARIVWMIPYHYSQPCSLPGNLPAAGRNRQSAAH